MGHSSERLARQTIGPYKVPEGLTDEQVLFLSDIFPTGYMAADFCNLKGGETVAIWGCGPVGQFAIKSAFLLGMACRRFFLGKPMPELTMPVGLELVKD